MSKKRSISGIEVSISFNTKEVIDIKVKQPVYYKPYIQQSIKANFKNYLKSITNKN
jgi:hypothetical protein